MTMNRSNWIGACLVVLSFAIAAVFYPSLPELVPIRWNGTGEVVARWSKPLAPFGVPLLMAAVFIVLALVPRISPRGFQVEAFARALGIVRVSLLGFLSALTALTLLAGSGAPLSVPRLVRFAAGVLLIIIGNVMPKFTRNFFIGIRTPWTLANDEVWLRTHRLGAKLFVVAGFVIALGGLLGAGTSLVLTAVLAAAGISIVYSYVLYRKLTGFDAGERDEASHSMEDAR